MNARRGKRLLAWSVIASIVGVGAALAAWGACTPAWRRCPAIDPARLAELPERLSETGLYARIDTEQLAAGVLAYRPRYELWTDGASKRRWIYLPPDARIDTTDPDVWSFPTGTKLWKELTRDGVRVETRLLYKHGAGAADWTPIAYVWRDGDAWATPRGQDDAAGTPHDVPRADLCVGCHGGTRSFVLGFSAIQLPASGDGGELDLASLERLGLVTAPLPRDNALPGDATTRAALGYLHANCSHCHNAARPPRDGPRCFDPENDLDFLLRVRDLDRVETTAVYRTVVGRAIRGGDADNSDVLIRVRSRDPWWGMPALGTEELDHDGIELLERWVRGLRAREDERVR